MDVVFTCLTGSKLWTIVPFCAFVHGITPGLARIRRWIATIVPDQDVTWLVAVCMRGLTVPRLTAKAADSGGHGAIVISVVIVLGAIWTSDIVVF